MQCDKGPPSHKALPRDTRDQPEVSKATTPAPTLRGASDRGSERLQLDLSRSYDARISDRAGPQAAERSQFKRDIGIKHRHQIVDALDPAVDLSLNGVESGARAGAGGADKGLERDRSLLLDLLKRREIPKRHVEAVEGGQAFVGFAFGRIERALQRGDMAL